MVRSRVDPEAIKNLKDAKNIPHFSCAIPKPKVYKPKPLPRRWKSQPAHARKMATTAKGIMDDIRQQKQRSAQTRTPLRLRNRRLNAGAPMGAGDLDGALANDQYVNYASRPAFDEIDSDEVANGPRLHVRRKDAFSIMKTKFERRCVRETPKLNFWQRGMHLPKAWNDVSERKDAYSQWSISQRESTTNFTMHAALHQGTLTANAADNSIRVLMHYIRKFRHEVAQELENYQITLGVKEFREEWAARKIAQLSAKKALVAKELELAWQQENLAQHPVRRIATSQQLTQNEVKREWMSTGLHTAERHLAERRAHREMVELKLLMLEMLLHEFGNGDQFFFDGEVDFRLDEFTKQKLDFFTSMSRVDVHGTGAGICSTAPVLSPARQAELLALWTESFGEPVSRDSDAVRSEPFAPTIFGDSSGSTAGDRAAPSQSLSTRHATPGTPVARRATSTHPTHGMPLATHPTSNHPIPGTLLAMPPTSNNPTLSTPLTTQPDSKIQRKRSDSTDETTQLFSQFATAVQQIPTHLDTSPRPVSQVPVGRASKKDSATAQRAMALRTLSPPDHRRFHAQTGSMKSFGLDSWKGKRRLIQYINERDDASEASEQYIETQHRWKPFDLGYDRQEHYRGRWCCPPPTYADRIMPIRDLKQNDISDSDASTASPNPTGEERLVMWQAVHAARRKFLAQLPRSESPVPHTSKLRRPPLWFPSTSPSPRTPQREDIEEWVLARAERSRALARDASRSPSRSVSPVRIQAQLSSVPRTRHTIPKAELAAWMYQRRGRSRHQREVKAQQDADTANKPSGWVRRKSYSKRVADGWKKIGATSAQIRKTDAATVVAGLENETSRLGDASSRVARTYLLEKNGELSDGRRGVSDRNKPSTPCSARGAVASARPRCELTSPSCSGTSVESKHARSKSQLFLISGGFGQLGKEPDHAGTKEKRERSKGRNNVSGDLENAKANKKKRKKRTRETLPSAETKLANLKGTLAFGDRDLSDKPRRDRRKDKGLSFSPSRSEGEISRDESVSVPSEDGRVKGGRKGQNSKKNGKNGTTEKPFGTETKLTNLKSTVARGGRDRSDESRRDKRKDKGLSFSPSRSEGGIWCDESISIPSEDDRAKRGRKGKNSKKEMRNSTTKVSSVTEARLANLKGTVARGGRDRSDISKSDKRKNKGLSFSPSRSEGGIWRDESISIPSEDDRAKGGRKGKNSKKEMRNSTTKVASVTEGRLVNLKGAVARGGRDRSHESRGHKRKDKGLSLSPSKSEGGISCDESISVPSEDGREKGGRKGKNIKRKVRNSQTIVSSVTETKLANLKGTVARGGRDLSDKLRRYKERNKELSLSPSRSEGGLSGDESISIPTEDGRAKGGRKGKNKKKGRRSMTKVPFITEARLANLKGTVARGGRDRSDESRRDKRRDRGLSLSPSKSEAGILGDESISVPREDGREKGGRKRKNSKKKERNSQTKVSSVTEARLANLKDTVDRGGRDLSDESRGYIGKKKELFLSHSGSEGGISTDESISVPNWDGRAKGKSRGKDNMKKGRNGTTEKPFGTDTRLANLKGTVAFGGRDLSDEARIFRGGD